MRWSGDCRSISRLRQSEAFHRTARRHGRFRLRLGGNYGCARLHPLFGRFLRGMFPPRQLLSETLRGRIEMLVSVLLPAVFALTGMARASITGQACHVALAAPCFWLPCSEDRWGDSGGAMDGQSWRDSLALGRS